MHFLKIKHWKLQLSDYLKKTRKLFLKTQFYLKFYFNFIWNWNSILFKRTGKLFLKTQKSIIGFWSSKRFQTYINNGKKNNSNKNWQNGFLLLKKKHLINFKFHSIPRQNHNEWQQNLGSKISRRIYKAIPQLHLSLSFRNH